MAICLARWWDAAAATFVKCVDLSTIIGKVTFKHFLRSANGVAHELARQYYVSKFYCNWIDEPLALF